jgi:hypothetical protein
MMPAAEAPFVRPVRPGIPTIDAAPTKAAPEREAAPVPAGAVPAIEIEAIAMTIVHEDAHSDLINKIAADSI